MSFARTRFGGGVIAATVTAVIGTAFGVYVSSDSAPPNPSEVCGPSLAWWYEAGDDHVTLNDGNVAQLDDRGPGGFHLTQAFAGDQPAYYSSGFGAKSIPYIEGNDVSDYLANSSMSIAAGTRTHWVVGAVDTSADRRLFVADDQNPPGSYSSSHIFLQGKATGGGSYQFSQSNDFVTISGADTSPHVFHIHLIAGGTRTWKIDGVAGTPQWTGNTEARTVETVAVFSPFDTLGGGQFAIAVACDNPTAEQETAIETYLTYRTGIAL